ncbi:GntR family transcriptional regulator [Falsiroseomonas ponticola]|uniref:GntR family transcriptional regulator n=1 Tax=Falsiroseomonas ponticola TaxID=2786951 RepID=UPI00193170D4|nr:GntR family transcriptional regulator [Roseomonas ponticola]
MQAAAPARTRDLTRLLEQDIHLGRLGPGSWLRQIDLEAAYGATRLDIRQALDRLVEKRLVRHIARRGYQVEDFDPARVAQVMETRAVLEVAAAALVIDKLDESALATMQRHAEAFATALESGTVEDQEAANIAFHTTMLAPCPNREMVELLFDLRARVPSAVIRRRNTMDLLRRGADHHFAIIRLIRTRDLPALQQVMREHNLSPGAP